MRTRYRVLFVNDSSLKFVKVGCMNYKTEVSLSQQYHIYRQHGMLAFPTKGSNAESAREVKVSAIRWKELRAPLPDSIIKRHIERGNDGIAIKTGGGLAVFDFDNAIAYDDFVANFPKMKDTMTNLSGGKHLPHAYVRYPDDVLLSTRHLPDVDLQAEGAYVVSNPTKAHGLEYRREHGDESDIIEVSRIELEGMLQWVDARTPVKHELPIATNIGQFMGDFVALYIKLRELYGSRNCGYCYGLLHAQTAGLRQAFIGMVRPEFIADTTNGYESPSSRMAEALRIEASALNYRISGTRAVPLTLPEQLCNKRYELGGQVLFGLWSLGLGGQYLPKPEIVDALHSLPDAMSRRNIYRGIAQINEPDFRGLLASYQTMDINLLFSSELDDEHTMYRVTNLAQDDFTPDLLEASHQHTMYRVTNLAQPSHNIPYVPSKPDSLALFPEWALSSGKMFRLGAVVDMLAANPGQYTPEMLASRLGLDKRTLQRYLKEMRLSGMVDSERQVDVLPLSFGNLRATMADYQEQRWGVWLQDENDKMYPAIHGLAARLLSEGHSVTLMRMRPNFYSVKDNNS
jgi:hypothetical protein